MANADDRAELLSRATKAIIAERGVGTTHGTNRKSNDFAVHPDTNLRRVLEIVQQDPVVRGAITTLVDRTLEPGYSFYGEDRRSRQKTAIQQMEKLRFQRLLPGLLNHLFAYSNAFIEIVREDGGEPKELFTLDPRYTEPYVDAHGEVKYYLQNASDAIVTWNPDDVVHLKTTPLSQHVWGDVDLKAVWLNCAIKHHIKKLYLFQYETNDFRPLLNFKSATDDQVKRFLLHLQDARRDVRAMVPTEGEIEAIMLGQMQDYEKVKALLTYLDYEILNLLQVPPIAVGLPDGSNRSSADAQERALNTRIRGVQRLLEDMISNDLLPKIGFEKVTLKFNVVDDKSMDTYLQMAERMKNMGIKTDLIKEFLESKGWDFPEGEIFDEQLLEQQRNPDPAMAPGAKKSNDMFPSRQGKMPGTASKKIGTGDQSTTRKEQLVSRAEPSWQKYGIIEVEDV